MGEYHTKLVKVQIATPGQVAQLMITATAAQTSQWNRSGAGTNFQRGLAFMDPTVCRIAEGIRLFNEREFFACHDVFEDFWSEQIGPEKTFFQGLIHAAVCLFHFEGGNLGGARRMYGSCCAYLQSFEPDFCGIDVTRLLTDLEYCFQELLAAKDGYPHGLTLHSDRIPVIHLTTESPADH